MPTQTQAHSIDLTRISLRERERGLVIGGVDTGKSTLADYLGTEWCNRYKAKGTRRLILDSKPRYRAQWTLNGRAAAYRYRSWSHGQYIPGSVVVDSPEDLELAFKTGYQTVIAQIDDGRQIGKLVDFADTFVRASRRSRPQLLQVDETLDFYHSNGAPRGGSDAVLKAARAGRERGTACLFGSQRTKGLPSTLMAELSRLYCFRIDFKADAKRLQEMGAPPFLPPTEEHVFKYWFKKDYHHVYGPYVLNLPAQ